MERGRGIDFPVSSNSLRQMLKGLCDSGKIKRFDTGIYYIPSVSRLRGANMLLNFKCKNFKSFRDGFEFNMVPESRMTEIKYSILEKRIGIKSIHALSASVIYGPNAAGKTSIVNAMSCFKQIITKGTIEDSEDDRNGDHVSANMNLIPFGFAEQEEPFSFEIAFVHH